MSLVFFQIYSKTLIKTLSWIVKVKQYLTSLSVTRYIQFWALLAFLSFWKTWIWCSYLINFNKLDNTNWMRRYLCLDINIVVNKLSSILVPVLLFKNVWFHINKRLSFYVPFLSFVSRWWYFCLNKSIIFFTWWVVNNNQKWATILFLRYWTFYYCLISCQRVTSLETIICLYIETRLKNWFNLFLVNFTALIKCIGQLPTVVVGNIFNLSSGDGIMMH